MAVLPVRRILSKFILPVFGLFALDKERAFAQESVAQFLLLQPSAVSNSMGGIGTASYGDILLAYNNPAGTAYLPSINFFSSFVKPVPYFDNVTQLYFATAVNFGSIGTFGLSGNFCDKQNELFGITAPLGTHGPDIYDPQFPIDWQLKPSYSRPFSDQLAAGICIGITRFEMIEEIGFTGLTLDVGVIYRNLLPDWSFSDDGDQTKEGITLGLAVRNVGPPVDYPYGSDISSSGSLGLTYTPLQTTAAVARFAYELETRFEEEAEGLIDGIHWGLEIVLGDFVALRGGHRFEETWSTDSWTWGGGITYGGFTVNLARYEAADPLGPSLYTTHIDAGFSFDF